MSTIEKQWQGFAAKCVNAPENSAQYKQTKAAFFAGAIVCMGEIRDLSNPEIPAHVVADKLISIDSELAAFAKDVWEHSREIIRQMKGRANRQADNN